MHLRPVIRAPSACGIWNPRPRPTWRSPATICVESVDAPLSTAPVNSSFSRLRTRLPFLPYSSRGLGKYELRYILSLCSQPPGDVQKMRSQSLGLFHEQAVAVVSAIPFRRETESSSGRGIAKPCLGLKAALVRARVLGLRSLRYPSSLERPGFRNCGIASKLPAKGPSMGGGLVPLPAVGIPVQSRLADGDGIVIVDHGSRRAQSNIMLHEFVEMYKEKTGRSIVEAAHMELAEPTISDAFDRCVERGATRVIISPYFLFPGRHWDKDIPSIAAEAAKKHPSVSYLVTAPIGLHELMVTVINDRMEYCLSQVAGEVSECDMCSGSGRCKQLVS